MTKRYVEFLFPGILFSEEEAKEIKDRSKFKSEDAPKGCFGYRFFDQEHIKKGKEILTGARKNYSGMYYFGEILTREDVKTTIPDNDILLSNMKSNGWDTVVKTRRGNIQPFTKKDKIVR